VGVPYVAFTYELHLLFSTTAVLSLLPQIISRRLTSSQAEQIFRFAEFSSWPKIAQEIEDVNWIVVKADLSKLLKSQAGGSNIRHIVNFLILINCWIAGYIRRRFGSVKKVY
jgi:hypothetical protein